MIQVFQRMLKKAALIFAGKNFGCGSSREQATICLKHAGVDLIIAKSFARIFYRNAINQGVALINSPEAYDTIDERDKLEVDFDEGIITNRTKKFHLNIKPLPRFLQDIINKGGLVKSLKAKTKKI